MGGEVILFIYITASISKNGKKLFKCIALNCSIISAKDFKSTFDTFRLKKKGGGDIENKVIQYVLR